MLSNEFLYRFAEAEAMIFGGFFKQQKNLDEVVSQFGDHACFLLQMIAKIYYKSTQNNLGNDAHKLALKLNPFLWHSFEELCKVGADVDPATCFQLDKIDSFTTCHGSNSANVCNESDFIIATNFNFQSTPIQNNNMYVMLCAFYLKA